MDCSCQSLINPIKELQQAGSNVLFTRVPHGKTHERKEGRKITHPWQPTRLNGFKSVCACHQHDILSRQAMIYLLTMGWFLAHTSLAMTPEHSAITGENSSLRSARAACRALQKHVPLITQSSSVTQPTHTPVARRAQMAALLSWQ